MCAHCGHAPIVCVEAVGDPVDQEAGVIIIMMSLSIATIFCSIIIKILLLLNHSVGSCTAQYNGKCVLVSCSMHAAVATVLVSQGFSSIKILRWKRDK